MICFTLFFQITLDDCPAAHAYGPQRRLIDDIGQFCAAGPAVALAMAL